MHRYARRDDQWDRIEKLLPVKLGIEAGRPVTTGFLSKRSFTGIAQASHGETCQSVSEICLRQSAERLAGTVDAKPIGPLAQNSAPGTARCGPSWLSARSTINYAN